MSDQNEIEEIVCIAYKEHKRMLLKAAYSCLKDYTLSEDCVQEAFLALHDLLRTEELENVNIKSFLIKVTRTRAFRYYRLLERENTRFEIPLEELEIMDNSFMEQVKKVEDSEAVLKALESLPACGKSAILLYYGYNLTYAQVANAVEMSESAVKKLIFRTMTTLRETYFA